MCLSNKVFYLSHPMIDLLLMLLHQSGQQKLAGMCHRSPTSGFLLQENLTWEIPSGSWRRAAEPRRFSISLKEVIRAKRMHRVWKLAGRGRELLDLELRWMGVLSDPEGAV